jgi:hypothetical protein
VREGITGTIWDYGVTEERSSLAGSARFVCWTSEASWANCPVVWLLSPLFCEWGIATCLERHWRRELSTICDAKPSLPPLRGTYFPGFHHTPYQIEPTLLVKLCDICLHPVMHNLCHILKKTELDILVLIYDSADFTEEPTLLVLVPISFSHETETSAWVTGYNCIWC